MKIPCSTPKQILLFTRREAIDLDLNFPPCSQGYHKTDSLSNTSNRLFRSLTSLKNGKSLLCINTLVLQYWLAALMPRAWLQSWAPTLGHMGSALSTYTHDPQHRCPSRQWLLLLARLHQAVSSSPATIFSLNILYPIGGSQCWRSHLFFPPTSPPETSSQAGDDSPPILRCQLVEIRSTVSVVFLWSSNLNTRGNQRNSACFVLSEPRLAPFLMWTVHLFSNSTFKNFAVDGQNSPIWSVIFLPLDACQNVLRGGIRSLYHCYHELWGWDLAAIFKCSPIDFNVHPGLRITGLEFSEISFLFLIILTASACP